MVNINQVPMSAVNSLIGRLGPTQAISLLNSSITSAAAVSAGIKIPYPNFTNPTVQRSQTVNQALRPFPQYLTIDTSQSGGDKSGHSTYNAPVLKLESPLRVRPQPEVELCVLQTADGFRYVLRQWRLRRGQRQSPPGEVYRAVRSDAPSSNTSSQAGTYTATYC